MKTGIDETGKGGIGESESRRFSDSPTHCVTVSVKYNESPNASTNHLTKGNLMKHAKQFFSAGIIAISLFMTTGAFAQDAVKVDSTHYKVEFENDQVRVLRVTYGPGEKSVMHEHPNAVAVFLNDVQGQFTFPDGTTVPVATKAGQVIWDQGGKHLPENKSDKPFQVIVVELKGKPAVMKKD